MILVLVGSFVLLVRFAGLVDHGSRVPKHIGAGVVPAPMLRKDRIEPELAEGVGGAAGRANSGGARGAIEADAAAPSRDTPRRRHRQSVGVQGGVHGRMASR
jgi:hypothetical protein